MNLRMVESDRAPVALTAPRAGSRHGGFTLVELLVVISITAFVFLALASLLAGAAKSLSIAKTRSQANEVATQGIEDLQRYDFNDLGVCSGAADPAPSTTPASLTGLTIDEIAELVAPPADGDPGVSKELSEYENVRERVAV